MRLNGDGVAHRLRADLVASGPLAAMGVDVDPATLWQRAPGR